MNIEQEPTPMQREDLTPTAIRREGPAAIAIDWSDETTTRWTAAELRRECPCATCREKRRADDSRVAASPWTLPVLKPAEAQPLQIESMRPVGSYAYNIAFTDGHASGIYSFAMLRRAAPESPPSSNH